VTLRLRFGQAPRLDPESRITVAFVGVALVLVVAAWATSPRLETPANLADRGTRFFPGFTDPQSAASLEVFEFNQAAFAAQPLKVVNQDGRWTIPSHYGYPADGSEKLATTAAALIALTKDDIASENAGDHERCGVIDPLDETISNSKGRGTRVMVRGRDESVLADIIIGAPVEGRDQMRYVRVPGQTRTYVSRVGALSISTKVDDWIERDLLKVNRDDIDGIAIQHFLVSAGRDNVSDGERLLLRRQRPDVWILMGSAPGQRLNTFSMNLLVTTLDELAIADVRPKPPGLAAALAGTGAARMSSADAADLETKGFLTTREGGLVPVGGEVFVRTNSGIAFQLRFGDIVHGADTAAEDRYLMISAGFTPAVPGETPTTDVEARLALLRARYAPWYFVVSEESYKRIVLSRKDLFGAS
jgi:hypothetical protein